jgi:hypothetical protein
MLSVKLRGELVWSEMLRLHAVSDLGTFRVSKTTIDDCKRFGDAGG